MDTDAQALGGERIAIAVCSVSAIGLIGASRVYLGVHYPSDVLAGFAAAVPWLTACLTAYNQYEKKDRADRRRTRAACDGSDEAQKHMIKIDERAGCLKGQHAASRDSTRARCTAGHGSQVLISDGNYPAHDRVPTPPPRASSSISRPAC